MSLLVILEIGTGDFEKGFMITLRIPETKANVKGFLPPAPVIPSQYDSWQSSYRERGIGAYRKLEIISGQTTNISVSESALNLQTSFKDWLSYPDKHFQSIRDSLLETIIQNQGNIRLVIQSDDLRMWQLPWHLWDILHRYQVEPSFNLITVKPAEILPKNLKNQVRILVILGDSTDIDIQADLELLKERLPEAYIYPMVASRRQQLNDKLWENNWDVLFFAGHSSSDSEQGKIYINESENITINDLIYALKNAIKHGLKLAIFNSCDGLGLARDLAPLQMPAIVVMREKIPDEAAQKFLEYFLKAFAENRKYLSTSVREARERLHGLEGKYPCASWLPVLFENPAMEPLTWLGFLKQKEEKRKRFSIAKSLKTALVASLAVTTTLVAVRSLGWIQPIELQAYDQLMRMRPAEKPDERLLIVKVTEADIQSQKETYRSSLGDEALAELLRKIKPYQPRAIGLNIVRDFAVKSDKFLAAELKNNKDFIASCTIGYSKDGGIAPPPEIKDESQFGFDDVWLDKDDIVRRQRFGVSFGKSRCKNSYSFSLRLAVRYLESISNIRDNLTKEGYLQIGSVVFYPLEKPAGGYQNFNDKGHQILLNYRSSKNIAKNVSLKELLHNPSLVKNRIVLIGVDAVSASKDFSTPYSYTPEGVRRMPGVLIHAHMISNILSAVLDNRPLIKVWPQWGEVLWIWGWSLTGGILVCTLYRITLKRQLLTLFSGLTGVVLVSTLWGVAVVLLVKGWWVPVLPSSVGLLLTGTIMLRYTLSPAKQYP